MTGQDRRVLLRRVFRSLLKVARALSEGLELKEILRHIAREACGLVEAGQCSIMLLDETGARLLTAAAHGLSREEERRISFEVGEGVAGWVAEHASVARIADVRADDRFKASADQKIDIRSLLSAPLVSDRGCIGVITVTHPTRVFTADDEELLELLADAIVIDLEIARLRHLAYRDPLTDAESRRGMAAALELAVEAARADARPLALLLFDLDHFKRINDDLGHHFGDLVLRHVVQRMRDVIRGCDRLFRYGGDEFLLLCPGVTLRRARRIADRITERVACEPVAAEGQVCKVSVSYGAAALRQRDAGDGGSLLRRADERLLAKKRAR